MSGQHILRTKIRFFRISRGLTQSEISSQLGLSLRTYQRLENGTSPLDVQTLILIAEIFEISFYELSNPEVSKEELCDVQFFKDPSELFSHAGLKEESQETLQKIVNRTKLGELPVDRVEKLDEFKSHPLPLFFTDLKKTTTNLAFRKSPLKNAKKDFYTTINHWKASEYCLQNPYIGFNFNQHYTVVLSPDEIQDQKDSPVLMGFHTFQSETPGGFQL